MILYFKDEIQIITVDTLYLIFNQIQFHDSIVILIQFIILSVVLKLNAMNTKAYLKFVKFTGVNIS